MCVYAFILHLISKNWAKNNGKSADDAVSVVYYQIYRISKPNYRTRSPGWKRACARNELINYRLTSINIVAGRWTTKSTH